MDIPCIIFGALFTLTGLLFALGKLHTRFTAWKHLPEEEKQKINIGPLCRNIGEIIMLCGLIFLAKGLLAGFTGRRFVIAMVAWGIVAIFDVWHISKSDRYQNK